jgi:hypothetical protein
VLRLLAGEAWAIVGLTGYGRTRRRAAVVPWTERLLG